MIKYVFRESPLTIKGKKDANAQKIGEALARITARNGGKLTPRDTVEAARTTERRTLGRHFEWRDKIAADAYRIDQARQLIRCVDMIDDSREEETPRPAFISITEKDGTAYRTLPEVMDSAELQIAALKQAERDFEAYEKRLRVFEDICEAIREVRERLARRRSTFENRPSA